jgi:hypothetical protein
MSGHAVAYTITNENDGVRVRPPFGFPWGV